MTSSSPPIKLRRSYLRPGGRCVASFVASFGRDVAQVLLIGPGVRPLRRNGGDVLVVQDARGRLAVDALRQLLGRGLGIATDVGPRFVGPDDDEVLGSLGGSFDVIAGEVALPMGLGRRGGV